MKPVITYDDWQKVDIRLGKIVSASNPDWSPKLVELHVDFGEEIGQRTIFTAMRQWHQPEYFAGKQALFIVNLALRKMGPGVSEGMLVALDPLQPEGGNLPPAVILFDEIAPVGSVAC